MITVCATDRNEWTVLRSNGCMTTHTNDAVLDAIRTALSLVEQPPPSPATAGEGERDEARARAPGTRTYREMAEAADRMLARETELEAEVERLDTLVNAYETTRTPVRQAGEARGACDDAALGRLVSIAYAAEEITASRATELLGMGSVDGFREAYQAWATEGEGKEIIARLTRQAEGVEGLWHPDVLAALPSIIKHLKQEGSGEWWAVGNALEKLAAARPGAVPPDVPPQCPHCGSNHTDHSDDEADRPWFCLGCNRFFGPTSREDAARREAESEGGEDG